MKVQTPTVFSPQFVVIYTEWWLFKNLYNWEFMLRDFHWH